ncbi:hypothetical protein [Deinococcus marmoris]|uniref:Uncharacterized protein n=1 Tax=Deinococcus marmoris TaxID=249408 RepID=A0A1U7NZA4_9DEIO|nr:hypothetical protein [Deinococcus marmoris]OLV18240.1 hypothetical protein BOO71_0006424 [Deinococcus marmoris]
MVSNEQTSVETFADYGARFQIEGDFLDEKSGLFRLEDSRLHDAASLERLILVLSVATLLLVSEGMEMMQRRALRHLKIGLQVVHHARQAIFTRLTLQTGPDPEPPSRRKCTLDPPQTWLAACFPCAL